MVELYSADSFRVIGTAKYVAEMNNDVIFTKQC